MKERNLQSNFSDGYCEKEAINLNRGDIKNVTYTTIEACKEECAKTEGCVAFTTEAGTINICWIKNKDHAVEAAANEIATSARMSCYEGNIRKAINSQLWVPFSLPSKY